MQARDDTKTAVLAVLGGGGADVAELNVGEPRFEVLDGGREAEAVRLLAGLLATRAARASGAGSARQDGLRRAA
jgi:hypothetical protein